MVEGPDLIIFNGQGGNGLFGDIAGGEWPASAPAYQKGENPRGGPPLGDEVPRKTGPAWVRRSLVWLMLLPNPGLHVGESPSLPFMLFTLPSSSKFTLTLVQIRATSHI